MKPPHFNSGSEPPLPLQMLAGEVVPPALRNFGCDVSPEAVLLVNFAENCKAAEKCAVDFIVETDVPVITSFRDFQVRHVDRALKIYTQNLTGVEGAVFLAAMLDFVSCACQEGFLVSLYENISTQKRKIKVMSEDPTESSSENPTAGNSPENYSLKRKASHLRKLCSEIMDFLPCLELKQMESMQKLIVASLFRLPNHLKNDFTILQNSLSQKISFKKDVLKKKNSDPVYEFDDYDDTSSVNHFTPYHSKSRTSSSSSTISSSVGRKKNKSESSDTSSYDSFKNGCAEIESDTSSSGPFKNRCAESDSDKSDSSLKGFNLDDSSPRSSSGKMWNDKSKKNSEGERSCPRDHVSSMPSSQGCLVPVNSKFTFAKSVDRKVSTPVSSSIQSSVKKKESDTDSCDTSDSSLDESYPALRKLVSEHREKNHVRPAGSTSSSPSSHEDCVPQNIGLSKFLSKKTTLPVSSSIHSSVGGKSSGTDSSLDMNYPTLKKLSKHPQKNHLRQVGSTSSHSSHEDFVPQNLKLSKFLSLSSVDKKTTSPVSSSYSSVKNKNSDTDSADTSDSSLDKSCPTSRKLVSKHSEKNDLRPAGSTSSSPSSREDSLLWNLKSSKFLTVNSVDKKTTLAVSSTIYSTSVKNDFSASLAPVKSRQIYLKSETGLQDTASDHKRIADRPSSKRKRNVSESSDSPDLSPNRSGPSLSKTVYSASKYQWSGHVFPSSYSSPSHEDVVARRTPTNVCSTSKYSSEGVERPVKRNILISNENKTANVVSPYKTPKTHWNAEKYEVSPVKSLKKLTPRNRSTYDLSPMKSPKTLTKSPQQRKEENCGNWKSLKRDRFDPVWQDGHYSTPVRSEASASGRTQEKLSLSGSRLGLHFKKPLTTSYKSQSCHHKNQSPGQHKLTPEQRKSLHSVDICSSNSKAYVPNKEFRGALNTGIKSRDSKINPLPVLTHKMNPPKNAFEIMLEAQLKMAKKKKLKGEDAWKHPQMK